MGRFDVLREIESLDPSGVTGKRRVTQSAAGAAAPGANDRPVAGR